MRSGQTLPSAAAHPPTRRPGREAVRDEDARSRRTPEPAGGAGRNGMPSQAISANANREAAAPLWIGARRHPCLAAVALAGDAPAAPNTRRARGFRIEADFPSRSRNMVDSAGAGVRPQRPACRSRLGYAPQRHAEVRTAGMERGRRRNSLGDAAGVLDLGGHEFSPAGFPWSYVESDIQLVRLSRRSGDLRRRSRLTTPDGTPKPRTR